MKNNGTMLFYSWDIRKNIKELIKIVCFIKIKNKYNNQVYCNKHNNLEFEKNSA